MFQTTRLSKTVTALLVLLFAVNFFVPDTSQYLALVPGRTLPCVWNLVTASFLTINPVELVVDIAALLVLARLVEPVYGSKEFLKFLLILGLMVTSTVFVYVYIAYAMTASGVLLYTQFCGFHGIVAGLLVAVKQVMPLHELKLVGTFKLKIKYLPSVALLPVLAIAYTFARTDLLAFYLPGTYLAWVYLRFFQQQPDSPVLGDPSDEFKFSSFFPEALEPVIDPVAKVLGFVTRLRHTQPEQPVIKSLHSHMGPSVLGSDSTDANRRRERGAKALEERLGAKQFGGNSSSTTGSGAPAAGAVAVGDVEAGSQQQQQPQ